MPKREINYVKGTLTSTLNYTFVGLMVFLTLVLSNPGFLFLLLAGELGVFILSQTGFMQRIIQARAEREWRQEQEQAEQRIVNTLSDGYKADFFKVRQLCEEIERRAGETTENKTSGLVMEGLIEKLSSFRLEYIRMLRAHYLLANRNYKDMQRRLEVEIKRSEDMIGTEQSPQVRATLGQNLKILRQRFSKLRQLDDLVRLLEARLQVVRNSLQLIQDEVYSLTDVRGISDMVDNLIVNLELNDEFRSYYDEVLSDQGPMLAGLETPVDPMSLDPDFTPEPPEQVNRPRRQRKAQ
jgi:hypothetical protein